MSVANYKLNSLFQQLEIIKESYVDLSSSSLNKESIMPWTEHKKTYEEIGQHISEEKFSRMQSEIIEEVICSILEMIDGYKDLNFKADIIDKETGESIIAGIQLHDKYRDYIETKES
ncbi:hypothetical protein [Cohnella lupini]|uniref:Uncharacterized protein n=1 Tax=Cohnella lupini TaxID=1294267 RepID=A0A3D9IWU4_9BACL|nr:hypothetical protein [Cohnella lupini]RED66124.1 hypothetical protein DFP95_101622 [Cohnella lupini]